MNIQFGNFIEELMRQLIHKSGYEILEKYSGKKSNKFEISSNCEKLIDEYITNAQIAKADFNQLKKQILSDTSTETIRFKHDIDLLFQDKDKNIFYVEIKYNDDHDTGKFIDINRKFIKTYAYLIREFGRDIRPILFYFNNKRMKGNIYLPESTNIYRGERFFKEFLKFDYKELENLLLNFAQSAENIAKFDELYKKITR